MKRTLADILSSLPTTMMADYDGMTVSVEHWTRINEQYFANASKLPVDLPQEFCGIKIVANPAIPEGFAVLTLEGEAVGVVDFKNNKAWGARKVTA